MAHTLKLADTVRISSEVHGVFIGSEKKITPHAGGEVDDDVHLVVTYARDHFRKKVRPATGLAGVRIPDMNMNDSCTGLCSFYGSICNFLGSDRNGRMFTHAVAGAGDGATDYNFAVHLPIMPYETFDLFRAMQMVIQNVQVIRRGPCAPAMQCH